MNVQSVGRTGKRPIKFTHERWSITKELLEAEKYYKRALKAAPNHRTLFISQASSPTSLAVNRGPLNSSTRRLKRDPTKSLFYAISPLYTTTYRTGRMRAPLPSSAVKLDEADGEAWGNLGQALAGLGED